MSIETIQAEIAELEERLQDLRAQLVAARNSEPLAVYPSVESIDWPKERYEDNAETRSRFNDTFMSWAMLGSKPCSWWPPYRNVMVEGHGEVRRVAGGWNAEKLRGGLNMPDWYAIAKHRIYNLLAPVWVALVQSGDDSVEEDKPDQEALIKAYAERTQQGKAGLRYSIATWDTHSRGKELKPVYLAAGGNPNGATSGGPTNTAPNP